MALLRQVTHINYCVRLTCLPARSYGQAVAAPNNKWQG